MSQAVQICTVQRYFCTVRWYLWRARLRSGARRVMLTFSRCQTLRQRRYQMSPPHYGKIPLTTSYLRRNQCEHIRSYVLEIHKRSSSKIAPYVGPPIVCGSALSWQDTPPQDQESNKRYPVGVSVLIWECTDWDQQCMQRPASGTIFRNRNQNRTPKTYEITQNST